ncbi:unnamed protein product [Parascedosporium putredinis]|uniref:Uncharacterized protein n=1 Tax=Parascedosporium putredinis TaxID=1442378 RepID=A0A9P1GYN7_9PEZI|nr:unnamed protein product [Parascedosporium putredinis]CAI7990813.1 unnamed protein product [Parascedosporium putredinis]
MASHRQSTAMHSPTGEDETEAFLDLDLSEKTVDPGHQRRGCWGKGVYTFTKDATFLDEHMLFNRTDTFRTLHNWIPLSSGYVRFDEKDSYDLPQPYITPIDRYTEGPGYMVTLYHQLHCLSYLVEHLQAGYSGARLTEEVAHHAAHCFDYIRQGIMCAADTTLEGQTEAGPAGAPSTSARITTRDAVVGERRLYSRDEHASHDISIYEANGGRSQVILYGSIKRDAENT